MTTILNDVETVIVRNLLEAEIKKLIDENRERQLSSPADALFEPVQTSRDACERYLMLATLYHKTYPYHPDREAIYLIPSADYFADAISVNPT